MTVVASGMAETGDVVVIGAGVVGLAAASAFTRAGREVVVLERNSTVGYETSSRNSGVIHAGIYYPEHSLKAKLCVRGKQLLYAYCNDYGVPHRRCGKLIVATTNRELPVLAQYQKRAEANGVHDLHWLQKESVHQLEPQISCVGALLSPSTGIIDATTLLKRLQVDLEDQRGTVVLNTPVTGLVYSNTISVQTPDVELRPNLVVNCAGLNATALAKMLGVKHDQHFAKGQYYEYPNINSDGERLFQHLIYPVPTSESIGVHVTLDLHDGVKFGPDIKWVDHIDYDFDHSRKPFFVAAIRRYYPGLNADALRPGYTGIRSKLVPKGHGFVDFRIRGTKETGIPGYVEVVGIDSPGLTASLAIAEHLVALECA